MLSERTGNTTLLRMSDQVGTADVRNNVVVSAGNLAILDATGTATLRTNWLRTGWRDSFAGGGFTGTVTDAGDNLTGADPGFTAVGAHDLLPAAGSPLLDAAGPLEASAPPLDRQYVVHQGSEVRPDDGAPDLGAFERP